MWTEAAKLLASDGFTNDRFGTSVAIEGDTLLVGAPGASVPGVSNCGAVYVFEKLGGLWTQTHKVTAIAPASGDEFGYAVSLSGSTMAAGARSRDVDGGVFVFVESGGTWVQEAEILIKKPGNPIPYLLAGDSIAVDGDWLAVGVPYWFPDGRTFIYARAGGVWQESANVVGPGPVALDSNRMATCNGLHAVRTYEWNGVGWPETAYLGLVPGGSESCESVSMLGDTLAAGFWETPGPGGVRIFRHDGATWSPAEILEADSPVNKDYFGASVSLGPTTVVVGANGGAPPGYWFGPGSAYAFVLKLTNGTGCQNNAECQAGFCVDGVCCNAPCGAGDPSDCVVCSVSAGAASDGLCAPLAAGTVCHAGVGICDIGEMCDGFTPTCPADVKSPNGTACEDGDPCTTNDSCQAGVCASGPNMCGSGGAGGAGGSGGGSGGGGQGGIGGIGGQGGLGMGGDGGSGGAPSSTSSSGGGGSTSSSSNSSGGGDGGSGGGATSGATGGDGGDASSGGSGGGGSPARSAQNKLVPEDGGCGCRLVASERSAPSSAWAALVAATALAVRRRRSRAGLTRRAA
jgi:hypothetical protein